MRSGLMPSDEKSTTRSALGLLACGFAAEPVPMRTRPTRHAALAAAAPPQLRRVTFASLTEEPVEASLRPGPVSNQLRSGDHAAQEGTKPMRSYIAWSVGAEVSRAFSA